MLIAVVSLAVVFCGLNELERTDAGLAIEENAANNPTAADPPTNSLRSIVHLTVARATSF